MFDFRKATRKQVHLTMAITGPSGAGKTMGALFFARGLAGDSRIALIDTEAGSASYYADLVEFDVLQFDPPYETGRLCEAVEVAAKQNYGVLIVDSLSSFWDGKGGLLAQKEAKDRLGGNAWANWRPFKEEWKRVIETLRVAPIDVIVTMRSKTEYAEQDEAGKKRVVKLGFAPVAPPDTDYEFDIVLDVDRDHSYVASKDRTNVFHDPTPGRITPETGARLAAWRNAAAELPLADKAEIDTLRKPSLELPMSTQGTLLESSGQAESDYKALRIATADLIRLHRASLSAGIPKGEVKLVLEEVAREMSTKAAEERLYGREALLYVAERLGLPLDSEEAAI